MYLDPIVSDDLVLDMIRGELSLSLKLSVYWQDIRLITRCVILLMLMADADNYENDDRQALKFSLKSGSNKACTTLYKQE